MVENYKYTAFHGKSVERATYHLTLANHLLRETYPITRDAKLLLVAAEHLYLAADHILTTYYPHEASFSERVRKLSLRTKNVAEHLRELSFAVRAHEESPLEFCRNGDYIICSDSYNITKLSAPLLLDLYNDLTDLAHGSS